MRNYITRLPELVYETTAVLEFDDCHVRNITQLFNLALLTTFVVPLIRNVFIITFLYFYFHI